MSELLELEIVHSDRIGFWREDRHHNFAWNLEFVIPAVLVRLWATHVPPGQFVPETGGSSRKLVLTVASSSEALRATLVDKH